MQRDRHRLLVTLLLYSTPPQAAERAMLPLQVHRSHLRFRQYRRLVRSPDRFVALVSTRFPHLRPFISNGNIRLLIRRATDVVTARCQGSLKRTMESDAVVKEEDPRIGKNKAGAGTAASPNLCHSLRPAESLELSMVVGSGLKLKESRTR
jgi:hypothetical protein